MASTRQTIPGRPLPQSIDGAIYQFNEVSDRATALINRLDAFQIARRPKPEGWSVAECLIHLVRTAELYFPMWDEQLALAREQNRVGKLPYKLDFWGRLLIWFLEPPPKIRTKAIRELAPIDVGPPDTILPQFLAAQSGIIERIEAFRGLAIDKITIPSPIDGRLHYSIWSSFCVAAAHERRHFWQALKAAKDLGA